jgi:hypothetical protein
LKKILLPLASLFLCYRFALLMLHLISSESDEYSNIEGFVIAFLLTLFITGIFAFPGFAYPTNKLLPDEYYKIKKPKKLNYVSKVLGVRYFKLVLLIAFWGWKKNRKKYFNGTKKGLKNFVFQTKQAEFGHLGAFIVILISSVILFINGHMYVVLIMTALNILGNMYPIILQRIHRARVHRLRMKLMQN